MERLIRIMEPDFIHKDGRGLLVQLVHGGYKQVNAVVSEAKTERGGHYHKLNKETFYVISGEFTLRAELDGKQEEYQFGDGDMFEIPPYVLHGFEYARKTILVAMYDMGVELEGGGKDIYPAD